MERDMVVLRYAIPIGISRIDGLSMGPSGFGASHTFLGANVIDLNPNPWGFRLEVTSTSNV